LREFHGNLFNQLTNTIHEPSFSAIHALAIHFQERKQAANQPVQQVDYMAEVLRLQCNNPFFDFLDIVYNSPVVNSPPIAHRVHGLKEATCSGHNTSTLCGAADENMHFAKQLVSRHIFLFLRNESRIGARYVRHGVQ
jgi:hypothetical protein